MKEGSFMNHCLSHLTSNMNPRNVSRKILCTYCRMLKELSSSYDTSAGSEEILRTSEKQPGIKKKHKKTPKNIYQVV